VVHHLIRHQVHHLIRQPGLTLDTDPLPRNAGITDQLGCGLSCDAQMIELVASCGGQ
jgi:hypothetical protein